MIHLDTCVLIDFARELAQERPGPAFDAFEAIDQSEILAVSVHALCELRAGAELHRRAVKEGEPLDDLVSGLLVCYPDERFAPMYGRLRASARRAGARIATMDLLIATAAILDDAPLLTRNLKDFSRIPGLRMLRY